MSSLNSENYHFTSTDGKVYARQLYGIEAVCTTFIENAEGMAMYIGGVTVAFREKVTRSSLEAALHHAWLRARYLAPSIACKTLKRSDGNWCFQYEVPTMSEADQWAKDTIVAHADPRALVEYIHELEAQWWTLDHRHYNIYLHVLPASEDGADWQIVYQGPHLAVDARAMMQLLEYVLDWTLDELQGYAQPMLSWGDEVARLPPALAACAGGLSMFPPNAAISAPPPEAPSGAPAFIPFMAPLLANQDMNALGLNDNMTALLKLSKDETARFRALCRLHGTTVTNTINALLCLAEVEFALEWALEHNDPGTYEETVRAYDTATHMLFSFTVINHRLKLPQEYRSLRASKGTPMLAVDATQLLVDIHTVKSGVRVNRSDRSLECKHCADVVWKVVDTATTAWNATPNDVTALLEREHKVFLMMPYFSPAPLQMRALFASSIGDFDGMEIMSPKYLPGQSPALEVLNMHHGMRNTLPQLVPISWQYDGQLTISFQTSRKWQTQAQMNMFEAVFRRWLDAALSE